MRPTVPLLLLALFTLPSCAYAVPTHVNTASAGAVRIETVARNLEHPWGLAFLPDGRMLVTERPGRLRVVSQQGQISAPVSGVPAVFARGQGGLLDVALGPDFQTSRMIYLSYAEQGPDGDAGTAVARGRLNDAGTALDDVQVIFRQVPKVSGGNHFGSRLVFSRDGKLFITMGERFKFEPAQDLGGDLGKIARINPDGSVPNDNPFVGRQGVRPEIWSYGHRNIESAHLHPQTGALWIAEMGPRGGDELTQPEAGRNYGWPLVSAGTHYNGTPIPDPSTRPDLAQSTHYWVPSISPSGMAIYTGDLFPAWRGSLLIGGLTASGIVRVTLNNGAYAGEERIRLNARVRDVRQGPDGAVYVLIDDDDAPLLRLTPFNPPR
ncbi:MAG: PQQ-dependent sugar dehydrogenase [Acetobacteraceae bacterium]